MLTLIKIIIIGVIIYDLIHNSKSAKLQREWDKRCEESNKEIRKNIEEIEKRNKELLTKYNK